MAKRLGEFFQRFRQAEARKESAPVTAVLQENGAYVMDFGADGKVGFGVKADRPSIWIVRIMNEDVRFQVGRHRYPTVQTMEPLIRELGTDIHRWLKITNERPGIKTMAKLGTKPFSQIPLREENVA